MKKNYRNEVDTIEEAFYVLEDFISTMKIMKEVSNIDYRFRINNHEDKWIVKMFVDEKETMDKIFGRVTEPPTIL